MRLTNRDRWLLQFARYEATVAVVKILSELRDSIKAEKHKIKDPLGFAIQTLEEFSKNIRPEMKDEA